MAAEPQKQLPGAEEKRMPFLEHLSELRTALRNSAIGILVATLLAYAFRAELFALMARPMMAAWQEAQAETGIGRPEMVFTSPIEPFMVLFKLALLAGLAIGLVMFALIIPIAIVANVAALFRRR